MPLAATCSMPDLASPPASRRSRASSTGATRGTSASTAGRLLAQHKAARDEWEKHQPTGWTVPRCSPHMRHFVSDSYSAFVRPHQPQYPYDASRSSKLPRVEAKLSDEEVPNGWTVQRYSKTMLTATKDAYTGCPRAPVKTGLAPLPDPLPPPAAEPSDHDHPPGWSVPRHAMHMMKYVRVNGVLIKVEE
mmetsp:Transcript_29206/g.51071  ORF Transcript_29206/g.51071 Transcript_29206/m.51071 type:complete len:190 (+) Transcript_29206:80-649(+)